MRIRFVSDNWKSLRSHQTQKWKNYTFIENFEKALIDTQFEYDVDVQYYTARKDEYVNKIQYSETTPFVKQIKLVPNDYFLNWFPDLPIWKNTDIDSDIMLRIGSMNKYDQPQEQYTHDKPYILFALQSLNFMNHNYMDVKQFAKVMLWAEHNKTDVLFKLHPFNRKNDLTMRYWNSLRKTNAGGKYVHLIPATYNVDHLIQNSEGVWTHSSGVAFQALVHGKPVVSMTENVDWASISSVYRNPLETIFTKTSSEDVLRFLSWYYHKLTLDSTSDNLSSLIEARLERIVSNNFDIEKIF